MKINPLEAHDRLLHLIEDQTKVIFQGAEECLLENPLSLAYQEKSRYIYLFAIPITLGLDERCDLYKRGNYPSFEKVPSTRLRWQPRLFKPEAQENSYVFRAYSKTDIIEVCWLLPPKEMWKQYTKGNVTESDLVSWSIHQFLENKKNLEAPHKDDLPEERQRAILRSIIREHEQILRNKKVSNIVNLFPK